MGVVTKGIRQIAEAGRDAFLGAPKITSDRNAADLRPSAKMDVEAIEPQPFSGNLTVRHGPQSSAVFDNDKVVASYDKWNTLVVDPKYRRQGIAQELVYQRRTQFPDQPPATERTKAAQAVQEKVWDRIQREAQADQIGNPNLLASAAPAAIGTTTALAALLPSEQAEAGVVGAARPILEAGKRISVPLGSVLTKPINKPLYRETNGDGLGDLLEASFSNTEGAPEYHRFFVSDNPDLAIGQGQNKGVMVKMRGDAVSGDVHQKPGTGDIAGREYVTDIVGKDFIDEVMMTPDALKQTRKLHRRWLVDNFDMEKLPDGRMRFTRKGVDTGTPLASAVPLASAGIVGAALSGQAEESEASALNPLVRQYAQSVSSYATQVEEHRNQYNTLRQRLSGVVGSASARLAEVAAALDRPAGAALRALDMPAQGILGLSRVAGGLAAGEGLQQALNQGANVARADPMDTATALGGLVVDEAAQTALAPLAPALGTATMLGALALSPI